jgi:pyridoxine 4-dehydrogenase
VHEIANVEVEMSLFSTDPFDNGVAETCAELNIPLVAYSPLSRGFLTGQLRKCDDMDENDGRRHMPRFQPEVFDQNLRLVDEVEEIAKKKGVSMPQVAIGWIAALSGKERNGKKLPTIIPIPGAASETRVTENLHMVKLDDNDMEELETGAAKDQDQES